MKDNENGFADGFNRILFGVAIFFVPSVFNFVITNSMFPPTGEEISTSGSFLNSLPEFILSAHIIVFRVMGTISVLTGLFSLFLYALKSENDSLPVLNKPKPESKKPEKNIANSIIPSINQYDMEDTELNNKINSIISKIDQLSQNQSLYEEDKQLLESIKNKYLYKIVANYIGVPVNFRYKKTKNNISATEMAMTQLDKIEDGIQKIEINLLDKSSYDMRVMTRFLDEKFKKDVTLDNALKEING